MRNGGIWNSNIETDNFGVKDITSIQSEKWEKIAEYISNQLKQDEMSKQLVLDFQDPFNG